MTLSKDRSAILRSQTPHFTGVLEILCGVHIQKMEFKSQLLFSHSPVAYRKQRDYNHNHSNISLE